jgi:hypothetical protein
MSDDRPFAPEEILRVLDANRVRYVVVGAYGLALHGVHVETLDIDITPQLDAENFARLGRALDQLQARVVVDEFAERGVTAPLPDDPRQLAAGRITLLTTPHGDLDLVIEPKGYENGYVDVSRGAALKRVGPLTVRVAAVDVIARSKRLTGRAKDFAALERIERFERERGRGL